MQHFQLMATCAAGIEALVGKELRELGYTCQVENGRVLFQGSAEDIAKTNLWLRTADRIKIILGQFKAKTFEELFQQTKALPWETLLPMDANFPVSGKSVKSILHHVPSCQAITKKAIVTRLSDYYHRKTKLPETGAIYPIEVSILKDIVTLTLDTTGSSLFKRGYRSEKGGAPLKENMAAALVSLTTWFPDRPLYDPTCGSGTILIEAALMALNIAPGLNREFVSQHWRLFDNTIWQEAKQEAKKHIKTDITLDILGTDIDPAMIDIAKCNAEKAGVSQHITFKQMQLSDFKTTKEFGILISNPPYGDRLLDEEKVHHLYRQMGETYAHIPTWSKYILTSDLAFEDYYGQKATKKRKLYNGALRTDFFQFWGIKPKRHN
ncbi:MULTISPECIES: class I SAM-dependent RNA methyltransferase [unclassified Granulicatella]|uniref:THUMP domain-containing class I SAM-dependent RNA methyltransferase n=1 Tax=unclassified Granulicatella TaxID=2630493 RepID=UPI001073C1B3|nr:MULTISPECIES: class I SAM-dependent RNA methyltransferase [unclassified Granulicatella]MBF0779593.1 class I SAM-dependent RNA methyltransferase [Granulicatella sp. 19428wC4_WM01]TFU96394.1 class I SAM-dependent RNA methyltransferase [Granulicatella sp. WM01]